MNNSLPNKVKRQSFVEEKILEKISFYLETKNQIEQVLHPLKDESSDGINFNLLSDKQQEIGSEVYESLLTEGGS